MRLPLPGHVPLRVASATVPVDPLSARQNPALAPGANPLGVVVTNGGTGVVAN